MLGFIEQLYKIVAGFHGKRMGVEMEEWKDRVSDCG